MCDKGGRGDFFTHAMSFKPTFHHYDPKLVSRARDLRRAMTPAERRLWYDFLFKQKPRWLRQRPIVNFIVDFYCPTLKLVIEIDGETHMNPEAEEYDTKRTERLEKLGVFVIRLTNAEVLGEFDETCKKIGDFVVKRSS